jgi:hypothetical protein
MGWLPKRLVGRFKVAEDVDGFHPKAAFWRELDGSLHGLVGSSNLTRAAFTHNYEANVYFQLSEEQFAKAKHWINSVSSVAVTDDWLDLYVEAPKGGPTGPSGRSASEELRKALKLPRIEGAAHAVRRRRVQLESYEAHKDGLMRLFQDCAAGRLSNLAFYEALPQHWSGELDNRLQGSGWERQGKSSDFKALSQSFLRIVDAADTRRDAVVEAEIDRLRELGVRSRGAFLSEMLCLRFPQLYPVVNKPVEKFLSDIKFKGPRGASDGHAYVDLVFNCNIKR